MGTATVLELAANRLAPKKAAPIRRIEQVAFRNTRGLTVPALSCGTEERDCDTNLVLQLLCFIGVGFWLRRSLAWLVDVCGSFSEKASALSVVNDCSGASRVWASVTGLQTCY